MPSLLLDRDDTKQNTSYPSRPLVVLLEDSEDVREAVREVIKNEFDGDLEIVASKEQAIKILETKKVSLFIFDNSVGDNKHEGLDALEQVRCENQDVFVAIFSAFPNYKEQAVKLGCNLFLEKSVDLRSCTRYIAREMLQHQFELSMRKGHYAVLKCSPITTPGCLSATITDSSFEQTLPPSIYSVESKLEDYSNLLPKDSSGVLVEDANVKDPNLSRYNSLVTDFDWLEHNIGKYVVLIDGELKKISNDGSNDSKEELLNWLIGAEKYRSRQRFFAKIEKQPQVIDEPISLWFD
ncbi:MAG: response regulator transcription factor [Symploca sp. SIO2B6]|nr:response regulator transcription factor [Symploca sp. SIO2B6]